MMTLEIALMLIISVCFSYIFGYALGYTCGCIDTIREHREEKE